MIQFLDTVRRGEGIGKRLRVDGNAAVKAGQAPVEGRHLRPPDCPRRSVEDGVAKANHRLSGCNKIFDFSKDLQACR